MRASERLALMNAERQHELGERRAVKAIGRLGGR